MRESVLKYLYAGVAELADAPDLGSGVYDVQVQVLSPVPEKAPFGVLFQLNPPLRVGEIVFDYEIQLRWMKFASTASGWI